MPAYNEEQALQKTLAELVEVIAELGLVIDIVVVDDGSSDATASIARASGAVTLQLPFNTGVGGAVRTGLRYAESEHYERRVIMDADGQHDPRSLPALLACVDAAADFVVGSRFRQRGNVYPVGWIRRTAMRFLAAVVHRITGQRFSDVTSGYRVFSPAAIALLAHEYPSAYLADTVEVLLIADRAGLELAEVAVTMRPRTAGVPSSGTLSSTVSYIGLVLRIAGREYRRARS